MGNKTIHLFVPGRLCLMGEHSDWAGMNRTVNAEIVPGYAIVSGVEEGIYAVAEKCSEFIVESDLPIYNGERLCAPMDTEQLLEIAKQGGFFSYVAGVASYVNDNYSVGGVKITIIDMTLPIKSGLSSSAAVCVLVARAFNQLYNLKMNTKGEMLVAFRGEQRTPSRCGRLDQACAFGIGPVWMEFDGLEINVRKLTVGNTFYWVIADLNASKDTVRILADLNKCYPFPENEKERNVHEALGSDNKKIIEQAVTYLEKGDAAALGTLMVNAQANFDEKVAPACCTELSAPVLHSVLSDPKIMAWCYGAKGVGSQGDGTVQFLAKDEKSRNELMQYLKSEKGMHSFSLTLRPGQRVRKAIIPVAGFGTRLFPATKAIKKAFFPLLDRDGFLKPAILILIEQLDNAGIEDICLVIGEDERAEYEHLFEPLPEEHRIKLSVERKAYEDRIVEMGKKISYVYQKERLGFGHAVYCCQTFTENEPVLLLLGDMVYHSNVDENCSRQLIEAYEQYGKTMVSIHEVDLDEVMHYGSLHGQWDNDEETILKVDFMYEKPTKEYAEEFLGVRNKKQEKQWFAPFGQYILTPEVFEALETNIKNGRTSRRGEYELTDALDIVREQSGMYGFRPDGTSFDIGLPEEYRKAVENF